MGTLTEEARFSRQQWLRKASQVNLGPNSSCMVQRVALAATFCKQHQTYLVKHTADD